MPLDGEGARGVVELLADVFTDALELAAAGTLGAVRLVEYQRARQFGRQRRSLGLLPWLALGGLWSGRFKLCLDGGDVGLDHLVQQIELVGIELLAAAGEAVAPQHGEFVVQPLVECFQAIDALTQLRGQLAQLLGCQVIESGRIHGAECADCRPPRR